MQTYIAILRGINVGGKNRIRMADLTALCERLKFRDVATYIQSGNIVFQAAKASTAKVAAQMEKAISEEFGLEVPVLVRTADALRATVAGNPFLKERGIDTEKLHVTFLAEVPDPSLAEALADINYRPDRFAIVGSDIYVHCPDKYGETKFSNTFFERKLKVRATTRNWKTVTTLLQMAG